MKYKIIPCAPGLMKSRDASLVYIPLNAIIFVTFSNGNVSLLKAAIPILPYPLICTLTVLPVEA